ncbi:MAG: hypothetical protein ABSG13_14080 [Bryobacteraceae bacterium]|jgi:hypothetical protein
MFKTLSIAEVLVGLPLLCPQTIDPDKFKVNYFSNANTIGAADATVRVTNVGSNAAQDICAFFYVFDPNQEMSECCVCQVSPDGLTTLSVNDDLTSNPLTGVVVMGSNLVDKVKELIPEGLVIDSTNSGAKMQIPASTFSSAATKFRSRSPGALEVSPEDGKL